MMRSALLSACLVSVASWAAPEAMGDMIHYSLSGDVAARSWGSFHQMGTNLDGTRFDIYYAYAGPGTLEFEFSFDFDKEAPEFQYARVDGRFTAGRLQVETFVVEGFQDAEEGLGADILIIYGEEPWAPDYYKGRFFLTDPSGRFFETGDLTGVEITTSIRVMPGNSKYDPLYTAAGVSTTRAVPAPSSMSLAAIAVVIGLVPLSRHLRRPGADATAGPRGA